MQFTTVFALALSLVANLAPVHAAPGNPRALSELRSVMEKRDFCANQKCKTNGDCWKISCELGCDGKRCHPLITMCPRNCKIIKRDDGVIEIVEALVDENGEEVVGEE